MKEDSSKETTCKDVLNSPRGGQHQSSWVPGLGLLVALCGHCVGTVHVDSSHFPPCIMDDPIGLFACVD